jgi:hypothetical protein
LIASSSHRRRLSHQRKRISGGAKTTAVVTISATHVTCWIWSWSGWTASAMEASLDGQSGLFIDRAQFWTEASTHANRFASIHECRSPLSETLIFLFAGSLLLTWTRLRLKTK